MKHRLNPELVHEGGGRHAGAWLIEVKGHSKLQDMDSKEVKERVLEKIKDWPAHKVKSLVMEMPGNVKKELIE